MLPTLLVPLAAAFGLAVGGTHAQPPAKDTVRAPAANTTHAADSTAAAPEKAPEKAPKSAPAVIQFENQAFDMATVYVVPQFGLPVRLGQVNSGRTTRLVVPRSVVWGPTTVEIVAVPFAGRRSVGSGPVTIGAGEALRATLSSTANLVSVLPVP